MEKFQKYILENLESKNKTLKYVFNIDKKDFAENDYGLNFIGNLLKNPIRNKEKDNLLSLIKDEKNIFEDEISFKINDFIGVKKIKEFEIICDLFFQKNNFFLDKNNFSELKMSYFSTFPNKLISVSPVFGLKNFKNNKKFFLELKKFFLDGKKNFEQIFYEKIFFILEKNFSDEEKIFLELKKFFGEIKITQDSLNENLYEIYKNEILDFNSDFSKNLGKNIFNQKIEIGYNSTEKSFHILDGTHRFKAFYDLLLKGKIGISILNNFKIDFSESLISCEKCLSEIDFENNSENNTKNNTKNNLNFLNEILNDEKISSEIKSGLRNLN